MKWRKTREVANDGSLVAVWRSDDGFEVSRNFFDGAHWQWELLDEEGAWCGWFESKAEAQAEAGRRAATPEPTCGEDEAPSAPEGAAA